MPKHSRAVLISQFDATDEAGHRYFVRIYQDLIASITYIRKDYPMGLFEPSGPVEIEAHYTNGDQIGVTKKEITREVRDFANYPWLEYVFRELAQDVEKVHIEAMWGSNAS
jgi:hypothetical protein